MKTDSKEETHRLLTDAKKEVTKLQEWLKIVDLELEKRLGPNPSGFEGFDIGWSKPIFEHALRIHSEICRANGAALVRINSGCIIEPFEDRE